MAVRRAASAWNIQPSGSVQLSRGGRASALAGTLCVPQGDVVAQAAISYQGLAAPTISDQGTLLVGGFPGASTAYVSAAHPRVTGAFSVAFTLRHVSAASAQSYVAQGGSGGSGRGWEIGTPASGSGLYIVFGGVAIYTISTSGLTSGRTHRVCVVVSGNGGTATAYVNGVAVGSVAVGTMLTPSSTSTIIGVNHNGTIYQNPVAAGTLIGDVHIYRRALNAAEVSLDGSTPEGAWTIFAPRRAWAPVAAGGPVTHPASGDLVGQGSTVVGTAARLRQFASSGALAGAGSLIAGSAARTGASTSHATTGALAGQGAVVAGTAAHVAVHATSGAPVGAGAVVSGSAARVGAATTHATSGAIVGPGAQINGSAAGSGVDAARLGGFEMSRPVYLKRGKKFLIFATPQEADEYEADEAEQAKRVAALPSRSARRKAREAAPAKATPKVLDMPALKALVSQYAMPYDLERLVRSGEFAQLLKAQEAARLAQDDEDIEFLLMAL